METPGTVKNEIVQEYQANKNLYKEFSRAMVRLLTTLLDGQKTHSITGREKGTQSLEDKIASKPGRYNKLADITDLAGARVVTYYSDEVDQVAEIVKREFDPIEVVDKRSLDGPEKAKVFDYASLHILCMLNEHRAKLSEYKAFAGLVCEIQIRTILQHAWAEIEHGQGYKPDEPVPPHIRRRFSKLAALLETADDEFLRIRHELINYEAEIMAKINLDPFTAVGIDAISLYLFTKHDDILKSIKDELVTKTGMQFAGATTHLSGTNSKIQALKLLDITSLASLRMALHARRDAVVRIGVAILKRIRFIPTSLGILSWLILSLLAEKPDEFAKQVIVISFGGAQLAEADLDIWLRFAREQTIIFED